MDKTNDEILSEYRNYLEANGLVPNSIKSYTTQIRKCLYSEAFISISNLHSFINEQRRTLSQRTVNLLIVSMRSFSRFNEVYYGTEYFPRKIMKQILELKRYSSPENIQLRVAYDNIQVNKIMSVPMSAWRWQTLFTALNLGLRLNQIRTLKLSDIDLESRLIHVRGKNNKNKKDFTIPISPGIYHTIMNWVMTRRLEKGSIYYVENKIGKMISVRSFGHWDTQNKKLGFNILLHNCRYTFATNLWKAKKDLILCQKMLGHSGPVVTSVYLKLKDEEIWDKFVSIDFKVTD